MLRSQASLQQGRYQVLLVMRASNNAIDVSPKKPCERHRLKSSLGLTTQTECDFCVPHCFSSSIFHLSLRLCVHHRNSAERPWIRIKPVDKRNEQKNVQVLTKESVSQDTRAVNPTDINQDVDECLIGPSPRVCQSETCRQALVLLLHPPWPRQVAAGGDCNGTPSRDHHGNNSRSSGGARPHTMGGPEPDGVGGTVPFTGGVPNINYTGLEVPAKRALRITRQQGPYCTAG